MSWLDRRLIRSGLAAIALVGLFLGGRAVLSLILNSSDAQPTAIHLPDSAHESGPSPIDPRSPQTSPVPPPRQPPPTIAEAAPPPSTNSLRSVPVPPGGPEGEAAEYRRWVKSENHNLLLDTHKTFEQRRIDAQQQRRRVLATPGELENWALILYKDALATQLLEHDLSTSERSYLESKIDSPRPEIDLEGLEQSSPHLSEEYLSRLRTAVSQIFELDGQVLPEELSPTMRYELIDMIKRRKRYSNNYFETQIHRYFTDRSVSIQEKVSFQRDLAAYGDQKLTLFGLDYFQTVAEQGLVEDDDLEMVELLLARQAE